MINHEHWSTSMAELQSLHAACKWNTRTTKHGVIQTQRQGRIRALNAGCAFAQQLHATLPYPMMCIRGETLLMSTSPAVATSEMVQAWQTLVYQADSSGPSQHRPLICRSRFKMCSDRVSILTQTPGVLVVVDPLALRHVAPSLGHQYLDFRHHGCTRLTAQLH